MEKKLKLFAVVLLTYAFICCPVFSGSSFAADSGITSLIPSALKERIDTVKETAVFIRDSIPEWMDGFVVPPTSSEDFDTNQDNRKAIVQAIREKLGINRTR